MAMIVDMDLGKETQINVGSYENIRDLIEKFRQELIADKRQYLKRTMTLQAVVSGLLLYVNSRSQKDRLEILKEGVRLLENAVAGHPVAGFDLPPELDRAGDRSVPGSKRINSDAEKPGRMYPVDQAGAVLNRKRHVVRPTDRDDE